MKKRMNETSKVCSLCKIDKPLDNYHRETKGILGRQARCKDCHKKSQREWVSRKPENIWVFNLRRMGLTIDEYQRMADSQRNVCSVCGNPETRVDKRTGKLRRLAIDHDHSCCGGKSSCKKCIRSLLCQSCNQALGLLRDDPVIVQSLANYVKKNPRFWG